MQNYAKGFETASKNIKQQKHAINNLLRLTEGIGSNVSIRIPPTPYNENWFLRNLTYQKAKELRRNGHLVAIRWIPGHSGLIGNEKTNFAGKKLGP